MTVAIRKLAGTDNDYLAYATTFAGRGTYFVYFQDNIWGAMALHNFVEMLHAVFDHAPVKLALVDREINLKHPAVLDLLRQPPSAADLQDNPASNLTRENHSE